MVGGLTRVAHRQRKDIVSMQQGGASKDVWVLGGESGAAANPAAPGALAAAPLSPPSTQTSLLAPPCCIDTISLRWRCATRVRPPTITRYVPSAAAAANTRKLTARLIKRYSPLRDSTGACDKRTHSWATYACGCAFRLSITLARADAFSECPKIGS